MQAPANEKLANLLTNLHQKRRKTLIQEKRVHDLIVAATEENWAIIRAYGDQIAAIIETIVREGIEAHEFGVSDAAQTARSVVNVVMPFYHPILVEQGVQNGEDIEADLRDQIRFIVRALRCPD